MSEFILEPLYDDDDDEFDGCEHGVGFDENCWRCEECHTVEMLEQFNEEGKQC